MTEVFDPYHTWLGISPDEQPANHYRLLGISRFEDDPEVLDNAADRQMAHLRGYQTGRHQKYSQQLLNEVAAARLCLLKSATKAAYDGKLRAELAQATPAMPRAMPTAPAPQVAPANIPLRRPTRPPDGRAAAARCQSAEPTEDVWSNLLGLGDVGSPSKIGKASTAKLAAAKRRKILFIAVPAAALLLIAVIAVGLMSGNRSSQVSADTVSDKAAVVRTVPAERPATTDTKPAFGPSVRPLVSDATPVTASQLSATPPLVINWPLQERTGAELKIDDQTRQPGNTPTFELTLERGLHSVRFTRPGFSEFDQSVSIGGTIQPTVRPIWQAEDGRGLKAELFRGAHFEQHVKSRVDPLVDFLWGSNPPDPDLSPTNFSIRWTGYLKAPKAGKYKLIAAAEDEMRVSVDGMVCLQSSPKNSRCETMLDLTGEPQAIEMELCQVNPSTFMSLRWVPPRQPLEQVIPTAALFYDKQVAQKTTVPDMPKPAAMGGLRAQLFDDPELHHIVKTRIDRQVDYLWGFEPPDPELPSEYYSIRWDGILQPPEAGKYTLITVADDGVRLWVDDELKVDDWKSHATTRSDAPLDLAKRAYRIRVEYFQGAQTAVCSLRWIRPGATRDEAIPSSALRPPDANVVAQGKSPFEPVVFPKGEWVDVLGLVDTARDAIGGSWTRNATEITGQVEGAARLEFPVLIDGSYDLALEFTRIEGTNDVDAIIPIDWWHCGVNLSGFDGESSGIEALGGQHANANPTTHRPGTLENGHRYREVISVRLLPENAASIDVSLDGNPYLPHWEGKRSAAELHPVWSLTDLKRAALGVMNDKVIYHALQLKMLSGHAAPSYAATVRQTRSLGKSGDGNFQDLVPSGAWLVGFRVAAGTDAGSGSTTPVIHRIQALYRNVKGSQPGSIHGGLEGDEAEAVAKEGYAVGGIVARSGSVVDGFKVVFMRVRGGRLEPADSYESPWLGGTGGNGPFQLGGNGGLVIGINGSAGDLVQSLALIVEDRLPSVLGGKESR